MENKIKNKKKKKQQQKKQTKGIFLLGV
jgi:hypothetical protein